MDVTATDGVCPFCKTALNPGATACTGCGAYETTKWEELGLWKNSSLGFFFFVVPCFGVLVGLMSGLLGILIFFAGPVGYFVFRGNMKKKRVWTNGGKKGF